MERGVKVNMLKFLDVMFEFFINEWFGLKGLCYYDDLVCGRVI